jgi:cytolysin (calcineurin-like family phosphatase)
MAVCMETTALTTTYIHCRGGPGEKQGVHMGSEAVCGSGMQGRPTVLLQHVGQDGNDDGGRGGGQ